VEEDWLYRLDLKHKATPLPPGVLPEIISPSETLDELVDKVAALQAGEVVQ
jgi:hypothetical protein